MASKAIGFLNFKFGADLKGFEKGMRKAQKNLKKFGKNIERTGKTLSTNLTLPILALGAASVKAFDQQAKAETKLLTALKGREDIQQRLIDQAKELQKTTLFGDEETIAAQSMLAMMGLEEEAIRNLIPLIQDFASAKEMDLVTAADLVAKSMGSSTNALSRYGIEITGAVGSSERLNTAVTELTEKFGGQAEELAKIGAGPLITMKNELGDVGEEIGKRLMPVVIKFVDFMRNLIKRFDELTNSQKNNIIKWGLFIATLGPFLIIAGKISLGLSALIKGFLTLRTTVLVASASFKIFMASMLRMTAAGWAANGMLGAMTGAFRTLRTAIMRNPIGILITTLAVAAGAFLSYTQATIGATVANNEFEGSIEKTEDKIKRISKSVGDMGKNSMQLQIEEIEKLIYDIKGFEIPAGASPFAPAGLPLTKKQQDQLKQLNGLLTKLKAKQAQAKKEADELAKSYENLGDITGNTGDDTNDLIKATEEYSMTLDPLISKIEEYATMSKKMWHDDGMLAGPMTAAEANYEKLFTMQDAWNDSVSSFGDIFAGSMESAMTSQENFFSAFIKNLKQAIGKQLAMLAALEITGFLLGGIGGGMLTKGLPKGAGDFLRGIIPMADGGVVMGPQMALIGEAGPEAVIPLDQLKNFGGAQQIEVVGKISGTDIFLSNRNTGTNRQRSV